MRQHSNKFVIIFLLLFTIQAELILLASSRADFSTTVGTNNKGWSYMQATSVLGSLVPMPRYASQACLGASVWTQSGLSCVGITNTNFHPGHNSGCLNLVYGEPALLWNNTRSDASRYIFYQIISSFDPNGSCGDGVRIILKLNGTTTRDVNTVTTTLNWNDTVSSLSLLEARLVPLTSCHCDGTQHDIKIYGEPLTCSGISTFSASVCSSHGNCIEMNTCSCDVGFTGTNCEFKICNTSDTMACNGRGHCNSLTACQCMNGYAGNFCELTMCNGLLSNNNQVCNTSANCLAPNTTLFYHRPSIVATLPLIPIGLRHFDITISFYLTGTNIVLWSYERRNENFPVFTLAINNNGALVFTSTDAANTDSHRVESVSGTISTNQWYTVVTSRRGKDVTLYVNGTQVATGSSTGNYVMAPTVANRPFFLLGATYASGSDATFFAPTTMTGFIAYFAVVSDGANTLPYCGCPNGNCNANVTNTTAPAITCFGISANNASVCSGSGVCSSNNLCNCNTGFVGPACATPVCFGLNATNPSVCSSRGDCISPNNCSCNIGYIGTSCNSTTCFSIAASNPQVCSGHGSCQSVNNCTCNPEFAGENCNTSTAIVCFGKSAASSSVCNNRNGSCIATDSCLCNLDYTGAQCEIPLCFGLAANSSLVCNTRNGTCLRNNSCSCNLGYVGSSCNVVVCNGKNSTDISVCSSKGICSMPNNCVCNNGWTGNDCQHAICNGVSSSNATVCSSHGSCSIPDSCSCSANWVGNACQIPVCFGVNATNPAVCSGRGSCSFADFCNCFPGFVSNNCQHIVCNGKNSSSADVCSAHGSCVAPEICSCTADWTGFDCQIPICYGINASNPLVCSYSNGSCISNNLCSCIAGYSGNRCEIPICHGLQANDSRVCSFNNGTCAKKDLCVCAAGYSGSRCEIPICYGLQANDSRVCSFNNGSCVRKDSCVCAAGYSGNLCEIPICYGLQANDSRVCTFNNGSCVNKDSCVCAAGYSGNACEIPMCYGIQANSSRVCTYNNGTCVKKDFCICAAGYSGAGCEIPICFGLQANDTRVCTYGNGTCTRKDSCVCAEGYSGSRCEIPICYGLQANDSRVCTFNNGTCVKKDSCVCNAGYFGNRCEIPICFGLQANDSRVCTFNNGTCDRRDRCSCNAFYSGNACEVPICFGLQANNSRVCTHGNGSCVSANRCVCNNEYTGNECEIPICHGYQANDARVCSNNNGTCTRAATCVCHEGYIGSQCEIPVCNGFAANQLQVCNNGNGTCLKHGVCRCNEGYHGSNCEIPICFDISASSSAVCSNRNGTCQRHSVCQCNNNYIGQNCEIPVCFNINATDARVCTYGNGTCQRANFCSCNQGYTGLQCEIPICYSIPANESRVCSNNGSCIRHDSCQCSNGYTGSQCEIAICNQVNANHPSVCNFRNGTCSRSSTCSCNPDYVGFSCEFPVCHGIVSTNSNTCSGHGECYRANACKCHRGWKGQNCSIMHCDEVNGCSSHGMCNSPNNCTCATSWTSANCSIPMCNGIASVMPSVCSGHGLCTFGERCSCQTGYSGANCQVISCFGRNTTSSQVCSGNGACVSPSVCQCNSGYSSQDCSIVSCNGILSSDFRVCNQQGACTAPDTCHCNANYAGNNCQRPRCNNIASDSSQVCNNRGNCTAPNVCSCISGYQGAFCDSLVPSVPSCYGKSIFDTSVCSAHGTCANSVCTCNTGYSGTQCEYPICHGKPANDFAVCSRSGVCISPNQCQCNKGFLGNECDAISCYGTLSTNASVCSSKALCIYPDTCACPSGFIADCSIAVCFSHNASSTQVCSGHGVCLQPGQCQCQTGYVGSACETRMCFGQPHTFSGVCSGHGSCTTTPNVCDCTNNYTGSQCQTPSCNGIAATDASVCSSRGNCIANDICQCPFNWQGDSSCSTCSPDYTGNNCTIKRCDELVTCNGHGSCNNFNCDCFKTPSQGYWNGTFCAQCNANYFGAQCTNYCDARTTCNAKGTCNQLGSCTCFSDAVRGYYIGTLCQTCMNNWYGPSCNNFVATTFDILQSGDKLQGELVLENSQAITTCFQIFDSLSVSKLGLNARCTLTGNMLQVVFGANPTLVFGETLHVNVRATTNGLVYKAVQIRAPITATIPVAQIRAQGVISVCDSLLLDGSSSSSSDGRALAFTWQILSGFRKISIANYLALQKSSIVNLPASLLEVGQYSFALTVTTFLGATSTAIVNITKTSNVIPSVSIAGPAVQSISVSSYVSLRALVTIPSCFYGNAAVLYSWRQLFGPQVLQQASNNHSLVFLPFSFPRLGESMEYGFQVAVRTVSNFASVSTAQVIIKTVPKKLVASIFGGNRAEYRNATITLDASPSNDPDNVQVASLFKWSCRLQNGAFCSFENNFVLQNVAVIVIPPRALDENVYNFTVEYSKGSRTAYSSVIVAVSKVPIPKVVISTLLPAVINRNERISIQGVVSVSEGSVSDLRFLWTVQSSQGAIQLRPSDLLTSMTSQNLVLKPNILTIGETYTFTLTATFAATRQAITSVASGYASTQFTQVNVPPQPGTFTIQPSQGTALQTDFTLSALQWVDENLPLTFTFGYYAKNQYYALVTASSANMATVKLPVGEASMNYSYVMSVRVIDSIGGVSELNATVKCMPIVVDTTSGNSSFAAQLSLLAFASLQDAILQNDPEKVAQLVLSVSQLLNAPAPAVPVTNKCPNSCSGHGSCNEKLQCSCDVGFATADCGLTQAELDQRKALREQMLTSLSQTSSPQPVTDEVLNQKASVLSQLTNNPAELGPEAQQRALNFLSSLLDSALLDDDSVTGQKRVTISDETASKIAAAMSNLASSAFSSSENSAPSPATSKAVVNIISKLGSAVLRSKVPGEEALNLVQPSLSMSLKKEYASQVSNLAVPVLQQGSSNANVALPNIPILPSSRSILQSASTPVVNIHAVTFAGNPYAYSNSSQNVSSSILSFSLKSEANVDIAVKNLSQPILLTIPGTFNVSTYLPTGACLLAPSIIPSCKYWDEKAEKWSTEGCTLVGISDAQITCACNHLTSFAGLVEYITPEINTLTPQDFLNLFNLNTDNYTTLIVVLAMFTIYVLSMIGGYLADNVICAPKSQVKRRIQLELLKTGKFRSFIDELVRNHIWLSVLFRPITRETFTRPQRVTIIYLVISTALLISALFYQKEQSNSVRSVMVGLISALINIPAPFVLSLLFKFTSVHKKRRNPLKPMQPELVELGFEIDELRAKNIVPVGFKYPDEVEMQPIEEEKSEQPIVAPAIQANQIIALPSFRTLDSAAKQQSTSSIRLQVLKEHSDRKNSLRVQRDQASKAVAKNGSLKAASNVKRTITKVFDAGDIALDNLELNVYKATDTKRSYVGGLLILVGSLLFYFGMAIVVCVIMEVFFKSIWGRSHSINLCVVSILIIAIVFMVVYFTEKKKIYAKDGVWTTNKKHIAFAIAIALLNLVFACGLMTSATVLRFWSNGTIAVWHFAFIGLNIALVICSIVFIILSFKKPKIKVKDVNKKTKLLPWWFVFILYAISWVIIFVFSVLIITYSIKFGQRKANQWMLGCLTGLAFNILLIKPINIFFKAFLYTIVIDAITSLLFRWELAVNTSLRGTNNDGDHSGNNTNGGITDELHIT